MPPDTILPEPAAPDSTPAPVDTSATNEGIYDTAFTEAFGDAGDTSAAPVTPAPAETPPQQTPASSGPVLSLSQSKVLERAGIDTGLLNGWAPDQIESVVGRLAQTQAEQDRLGAELGRLKQPPQNSPQPPVTPQPSPFGQRVTDLFTKLAESYDDDIKPLGELFTELHGSFDSRFNEINESFPVMDAMGEMLTDMALDQSLTALAKTYPSVETPEGRSKVTERFWKEWKTGEYSKPGTSLRQQIREAAENAAKVTFNNINEASAAASLVNNNKARVAAQPKVGATQQRSKPASKDDVYDQAYQETMVG